jgi:hypothetical protein
MAYFQPRPQEAKPLRPVGPLGSGQQKTGQETLLQGLTWTGPSQTLGLLSTPPIERT